MKRPDASQNALALARIEDLFTEFEANPRRWEDGNAATLLGAIQANVFELRGLRSPPKAKLALEARKVSA